MSTSIQYDSDGTTFYAWHNVPEKDIACYEWAANSEPSFPLPAAVEPGEDVPRGVVTEHKWISRSVYPGVSGTYKKLGKHVVPLFMLLLVVNYFIFAFTKSPALYLIANFIGGIGYFSLFVAFNTALSVNCSDSTFRVASGVMSALMNIGLFLSSYIMNFISAVAGQSGNMAFPFVICGIMFIIISVALFIKPIKM